MGAIRIKDQDGDLHDIKAVGGRRVMEIIREHRYAMEGS